MAFYIGLALFTVLYIIIAIKEGKKSIKDSIDYVTDSKKYLDKAYKDFKRQFRE